MNNLPDLRLQARVAARLHDPPEKSLVLMRTREGHEGGTVRALLGELFPGGEPPSVQSARKRADQWASAADRMAFPKADGDRRYPAWQQVRFAEQPVLVHPLTGVPHQLPPLADDIDASHAQAQGTDHLRQLVDADNLDKTALALWRFGPEVGGDLRELWKLLPADSRVPDHTIHDHLDLAAALASCFAIEADGGPALLAVSLGPVQDFIAAARSVSDLWAGSHLLAHLSWVAMRVVCESLGPEAVIFPRLRGVPAVDLWLQRDKGLAAALFERCAWRRTGTDENPLFGAALPNRFTAIVPAGQAASLAARIVDRVQAEALRLARQAFERMLDQAGIEKLPGLPGYRQVERQLAGFPEVHWAAVPWSLAGGKTDSDGRVQASEDGLAQAMQAFHVKSPPGFLGSDTWKRLSVGYRLDEGWFFRPNPGALYPALHELLERALAATKATRRFGPADERGWRCSLTGEAEWITTDSDQLLHPPGKRHDTLWTRCAGRFGIRKGEHLSALPMLKRLWPTIFTEDVQAHVQGERLSRYVVSTHTMALASAIDAASQRGTSPPADMQGERVALPARLARTLRERSMEAWGRVPGWVEDRQAAGVDESAAEIDARRMGQLFGRRPDAYFGMLLMDGDGMGAWLSASSTLTPRVSESFHPVLRERLSARFGVDEKFVAYAGARRAPNPAWHMAISQALNHFSLELAPAVIEREHLGKLIYAGGDDVLAMLATRDLLPAAAQLRAVYSGCMPDQVGAREPEGQRLARSGSGWAQFDGRVLRLMGDKATASAGLVIAHHQAPLAAVLRKLREAEQQAKALPGKNAWSLAVLKRGGGALSVTAHWGEPLRLFEALRAFLMQEDVSRRAAYHVAEWLHDLPTDARAPSASLLAYQMARQARGEASKSQARDLARRLVELAFDDRERVPGTRPLDWLGDFMSAAEFLAREQRHDTATPTQAEGVRA